MFLKIFKSYIFFLTEREGTSNQGMVKKLRKREIRIIRLAMQLEEGGCKLPELPLVVLFFSLFFLTH